MSQKAAVIAQEPTKGKYVEVSEIPIYEPSASQILIKTTAFALNPTDWKHILLSQGKPGDIAGSDASGIVFKVGSEVKGFKEGDVVSTFLHGNFFKERGAFTEYVIADPATTVLYKNKFRDEPLPLGKTSAGKIDTFEGAASITLSLVTGVLSFAGNLNINKDDSGYILIWGGATSAGILGIQLIKHHYKNLKVITTASSKNAEFLKSIGAQHVVDYNDSDAVEQIKKIANGGIKYAWDTFAVGTTFQNTYDSTIDSPSVKFDSLLFKGEKDIVKDNRSGKVEYVTPTLAYAASGEHVRLFGVEHEASKDTLERYNDFWFNELPKFVEELVHPNLIVKKGFESVNEGFELLQDNKVSGEKIVFRE